MTTKILARYGYAKLVTDSVNTWVERDNGQRSDNLEAYEVVEILQQTSMLMDFDLD